MLVKKTKWPPLATVIDSLDIVGIQRRQNIIVMSQKLFYVRSQKNGRHYNNRERHNYNKG